MGLFSEEIIEEPFIFLLVIPYVAGQSAIASVMIVIELMEVSAKEGSVPPDRLVRPQCLASQSYPW